MQLRTLQTPRRSGELGMAASEFDMLGRRGHIGDDGSRRLVGREMEFRKDILAEQCDPRAQASPLTNWKAPLSIVAPLATPAAEINWVPPLLTTVPLVAAPDKTDSMPPLTVVLLAIPPEWTMSPLLMSAVKPEIDPPQHRYPA
jgi:hypothetical protein